MRRNAVTRVHTRALPGAATRPPRSPLGSNYLEIGLNRPGDRTPSLTVNGSEHVPVSYPKAHSLGVPTQTKAPGNRPEADARTRTGDPFITRERQVRDGRPRAGTRGHVLAGNQVVSRPSEWTRVPARARAYVPVLYPRCLVRQRAVAPDCSYSSSPGASDASSKAPETAPFVGKQQSRAALLLVVPCERLEAGR